jgi:hypothetical protein
VKSDQVQDFAEDLGVNSHATSTAQADQFDLHGNLSSKANARAFTA